MSLGKEHGWTKEVDDMAKVWKDREESVGKGKEKGKREGVMTFALFSVTCLGLDSRGY